MASGALWGVRSLQGATEGSKPDLYFTTAFKLLVSFSAVPHMLFIIVY